MAADSTDDDRSGGTGGTGNPQMVDFIQLGDDSAAKNNLKRRRSSNFGQEKYIKKIKVDNRITVPPDLDVKQRNAEAKGHEKITGGEIIARRAESVAPTNANERLSGSLDLSAGATHMDIHPIVGNSAYFSGADNNNSADPRISPEAEQDTQAKEPQLLPTPALRPGAAPAFNPIPTKP